ncbi:venom carboxylesterase-6-like isoform X3 [Sitophilus oryzae]|uniref:Carboxylic ester hydrolase n=1 Tax=Sitophilus oryzae TaxID=7048 RepID=A0A6J2XNX0_SITOR|nr:venom carboxylesterase-6-like isoform X3 [Sitophilus oryzae]
MKTLAYLFALIVVSYQENVPILTIPDGQLEGSIRQTVDLNKTYYAFRGIPYAQPPVGNLRFSNPVKNDPWAGVLDATNDKSSCVQAGGSDVIGQEDCLYINVYTPNLNDSLPVMVWFHGGGFIGGSSSYENFAPDYFLEQGVIYVAFNYRLGVFGFLSTNDSTASGNWGLKDQVLALQWTKENIKYFGGDPEKITIFGQSAGAASVSYMLQAPQTKGLYRAAIMQSGHSLCLWSLTRNARNTAFQLGLLLGVSASDSDELISQLRDVDASKLQGAQSNLTLTKIVLETVLAGLAFGPVTELESNDSVVTGKSHEQISNGTFQQVPILMGFNSKEAVLLDNFVDFARQMYYIYDIAAYRIAPYDLTTSITDRYFVGQQIKNYYSYNSSLTNYPEAFTNIFSIDQFNRPIREAVQQFLNYVEVYFYEFSYEGELGYPDRQYPGKGVGHAEDLHYFFVSNNSATDDDLEVRRKLVLMWTNFAKYLNPTPDESVDKLDGVVWPANSPDTNITQGIQYLDINKLLSARLNPDQSNWNFYKEFYDQYGMPPYDTY